MLEHGQGFLVREFAAVQRRAFAFGEALLTSAAGEHTAIFVGAITEANAEVVQATVSVVGAVRILAAEGFQVVHGGFRPAEGRGKKGKQLGLDSKTNGGSAKLIRH